MQNHSHAVVTRIITFTVTQLQHDLFNKIIQQ